MIYAAVMIGMIGARFSLLCFFFFALGVGGYRLLSHEKISLAASLLYFGVGASAGFILGSLPKRDERRGLSVAPTSKTKRLLELQVQDVYFAGFPVPNAQANQHFLVVGMTGSGKTNVLRMMMKSTLPNVLTEPNYRAVVYDQKQDMVGLVKAQGIPDTHLRILNPFDSRCHEWDIARDVTGPDTSFQIASIFIPEEDSQNRYFSDAARDLLAGVMDVFIKKGLERKAQTQELPDWRLSDVLVAMGSQRRLRHVLSLTEEGKELIDLHLDNERTTKSILSTARTRLTPLRVPAALWKKAGDAGRKMSLREFLQSPYVLILGNNQAARLPLQALNRILFQRLSELLLDLPDNPDEDAPDARRVWFYLDEARKIGKLSGLDDLMNNGRSKGACLVLAFQDIDGLRAVYGKEVAQEITAMCGNLCILRLSGTETPRWASDLFGEFERKIQLDRQDQQTGKMQGSVGTGDSMHRAPVLLPSQFRQLAYASPHTGMEFYLYVPSKDEDIHKVPLPAINVALRRGANADPKDNKHEWPELQNPDKESDFKQLPVWEDADFARLGIPPLPSLEPEDTSSTTTGNRNDTQTGKPAQGGSAAPERKLRRLRNIEPV